MNHLLIFFTGAVIGGASAIFIMGLIGIHREEKNDMSVRLKEFERRAFKDGI